MRASLPDKTKPNSYTESFTVNAAGTLAGLGSARTRTAETFHANHHMTHFGRAQAILRSSDIAGTAKVIMRIKS